MTTLIKNKTTYLEKEENLVFNDEALAAAKNIQPDKKGLKKLYQKLKLQYDNY